MAMTAESLSAPLLYTIDLKDGLVQQPLRPQLMKGDKKANTIIVRMTDGDKAADLTGASAVGSFISPVDGAEIQMPGSVSGNEVRVTLVDECYAEDGYFEANVTLTVGETSRTILSITGHVLSKGSGAVIDIGGVIPNISDIIAQYAAMKQAVEETNAARDAANAAAEHAPYVDASTNNWMTWDTETGKYIDTGVQATGAKGDAGDTPYIGENGNWWIGGVDTGTRAQGPAGENGTGSGTVTGVKIGDASFAPNASGVVDMSTMIAPDSTQLNGKPADQYATADTVSQLSQQIGDVKGRFNGLGVKTVDLNTVTTSQTLLAYNCPNSPTGDQWCTVTVFAGGTGSVLQIAAGALNESLWFRHNNGEQWGPWRQMTDCWKTIYQVGSIYMSLSETSPASLFGGTWEQIKGRFLIGTGNPDANTTSYWGDVGTFGMPAGEMGGEEKHTLTLSESATHSHPMTMSIGGAGSSHDQYSATLNASFNPEAVRAYIGETNTVGGNAAHNNMPPYLAVYMWKRVA